MSPATTFLTVSVCGVAHSAAVAKVMAAAILQVGCVCVLSVEDWLKEKEGYDDKPSS